MQEESKENKEEESTIWSIIRNLILILLNLLYIGINIWSWINEFKSRKPSINYFELYLNEQKENKKLETSLIELQVEFDSLSKQLIDKNRQLDSYINALNYYENLETERLESSNCQCSNFCYLRQGD